MNLPSFETAPMKQVATGNGAANRESAVEGLLADGTIVLYFGSHHLECISPRAANEAFKSSVPSCAPLLRLVSVHYFSNIAQVQGRDLHQAICSKVTK